jgi:16S rRNA (guanine966-N2)-methyltransferase
MYYNKFLKYDKFLMEEAGMLRIIGGDLKGRKIKAPGGARTRPTSSKVREALFDIIGKKIETSRFLDLYAGSGAMGIEALSRGASFSMFVESHFETSRLLEENLAALNLVSRSRILMMPVEKALKKSGGVDSGFRFVFCDPPYDEVSWTEILTLLVGSSFMAEDAAIIIEHRSKIKPSLPHCCEEIKSYIYGDSSLLFIKGR